MRGARSRLWSMIVAMACLSATTHADPVQTTYEYDALGRLSSACFADSGTLITYSYDLAGNRNSVTTSGGGCAANNQVPQAVNDSVSGSYDTFTSVQVNALANDSDPDNDSLTITDADCDTVGCIVFISNNKLSIIGTTAGFKAVTYTISDGRGGTDSATATVFSFFDPPDCDDSGGIVPGGEICF